MNTSIDKVGSDRNHILLARQNTIKLFNDIKANLVEGIDEVQARKMALDVSLDHGVEKHWHSPYIRFGCGTALTF